MAETYHDELTANHATIQEFCLTEYLEGGLDLQVCMPIEYVHEALDLGKYTYGIFILK